MSTCRRNLGVTTQDRLGEAVGVEGLFALAVEALLKQAVAEQILHAAKPVGKLAVGEDVDRGLALLGQCLQVASAVRTLASGGPLGEVGRLAADARDRSRLAPPAGANRAHGRRRIVVFRESE